MLQFTHSTSAKRNWKPGMMAEQSTVSWLLKMRHCVELA
jgi:hypothetical protein